MKINKESLATNFHLMIKALFFQFFCFHQCLLPYLPLLGMSYGGVLRIVLVVSAATRTSLSSLLLFPHLNHTVDTLTHIHTIHKTTPMWLAQKYLCGLYKTKYKTYNLRHTTVSHTHTHINVLQVEGQPPQEFYMKENKL